MSDPGPSSSSSTHDGLCHAYRNPKSHPQKGVLDGRISEIDRLVVLRGQVTDRTARVKGGIDMEAGKTNASPGISDRHHGINEEEEWQCENVGEDDRFLPDSADPGEELSSSHVTESMQRPSHLAVFLVLGAAVLLPFNTLITPTEFYRHLFATPTGGQASSFLSWLLLSYNLSTILFGAHATVSLHITTPTRRILSASSIVFAGLLTLTLLAAFASPVCQARSAQGNSVTWFYGLIIGSIIIAASTSYLQNAVVALCSIFGPRAMGLMLTGQGAVGAITAVVQLAAAYKSVVRGEERVAKEEGAVGAEAAAGAATTLFTFSVAFISLAITTFAWLARTPAYKLGCHRYEEAKSKSHRPDWARHGQQPSGTPTCSSRLDRCLDFSPLSSRSNANRILQVQRKVLSLSFSVFCVFAVTLAVYPSLTTRVTSIVATAGSGYHGTWQHPLVFVAWHMVAFNISDMAGRFLPSISSDRLVLRSRSLLVAASCARTLFVPLLLACNVRSGASDGNDLSANSALPDWIFFLLILLLGLTNGFMATSIFIAGPESEDLVNEAEKATAGAILSFWLTLGLAAGSAASFIVRVMV